MIRTRLLRFLHAKSVPGRPGRPRGGIGTPESLIFLRNYWCFGPGGVGMRFFCHFHPKITFSSYFKKFPPKWKTGAHFTPKPVLGGKRGPCRPKGWKQQYSLWFLNGSGRLHGLSERVFPYFPGILSIQANFIGF